MALRGGDNDMFSLQRAMMRQEVAGYQTRIARTLQGKAQQSVYAGENAPPQKGGRREGFDPHYLPPYPRTGVSPNAVLPGPPPAGNYRPGRRLDIHEILKKQAFASTSGSCEDHFEKNRACPSSIYGVSDQYVILDSFEKVRSSRIDVGEFKFNFMVQGVTRDQNIGVPDRLNTIIGIQVSEFCIPVLPYDDFDPVELTTLNPGYSVLNLAANGALPATGDDVSNPQSQVPFCGRVTMYLKEIGLQSFSDTNNRRHHFEFKSELAGAPNSPKFPDGDRIHLTPLHNSDFFLFTDPIQDVHGLTVCFFNPGSPLRFPPDCLYDAVASTDGASLLQFSYTDPTNLVNLAVGDRIFIQGFQAVDTSVTPALPYKTLNAYVTRSAGHIVGSGGYSLVGPTGPGSGTRIAFRLNPDVSCLGLSPPIPPSTPITSTTAITICIAKNRLRIPMRFRRVVGRLTNYIAP